MHGLIRAIFQFHLLSMFLSLLMKKERCTVKIVELRHEKCDCAS